MAAERIVEPVQGMHMAISRRWFGAAGRPGKTIGRIHDAISNGVYGSVSLGATALGEAINQRVPGDAPTSLKGRAIVNGLWGDDLGPFRDRIEILMEITDGAGDVVVDASGLVFVPPDATPHVVVLVHGLFESLDCWRGSDNAPGVAEILETRPHLTVLAARYNSGLRISENAAQLASMLDLTCATWPVPVESIVLVGSSMGGVLIRSACAVGERQNQPWRASVSGVVTVAAPHRGTPIEKWVNAVSSGLSKVDETRPLGDFLDSRSAGIKDLRHGMIDQSISEMDQDSDHHYVALVVTPDPTNPVGRAMSDLVVRPTSASGGEHESSPSARIVGGTNHFAALANSAVIELVVGYADQASPQT